MSDPTLRALAVAALLLVGSALFVPSPRSARLAQSAPRGDPELADLCALLTQAARGCACRSGSPDRRAWQAVERGLGHNAHVLAQEVGELPGLLREARWLATGARGDVRSGDDARFVAGFLHWYLEALYAHALRSQDETLEPPARLRHRSPRYETLDLREFRGMDYADFLGLLD